MSIAEQEWKEFMNWQLKRNKKINEYSNKLGISWTEAEALLEGFGIIEKPNPTPMRGEWKGLNSARWSKKGEQNEDY